MKEATSNPGWIHGPMGSEDSDSTHNPSIVAAAAFILENHFPGPIDKSRSQDDPAQTATLRLVRAALSTIFLDPRLAFFTAAPRRLPILGPRTFPSSSPSEEDFAFVSTTSNRAYVAVPACLAHLPAHYKRAWMVEPFDPLVHPRIYPGSIYPTWI